jgi:hypothetical protein
MRTILGIAAASALLLIVHNAKADEVTGQISNIDQTAGTSEGGVIAGPGRTLRAVRAQSVRAATRSACVQAQNAFLAHRFCASAREPSTWV